MSDTTTAPATTPATPTPPADATDDTGTMQVTETVATDPVEVRFRCLCKVLEYNGLFHGMLRGDGADSIIAEAAKVADFVLNGLQAPAPSPTE